MLPPSHYLSLSRLGFNPMGVLPDVSTLAAHDFDVDVRTGFMPPHPPPTRLYPPMYDPWESALEHALTSRFKLGDRSDLTDDDRAQSSRWRRRVQLMATLPVDDLASSEVMLRRAHHVLTFLQHIFIHTLPPAPAPAPIIIPSSIALPLLHVSTHLALPPILTYSDNVLYNWSLSSPQPPFSSLIDPAHLCTQSTFTGTSDEQHFYLTSARIELAGVSVLSLLRSIQDEAFVGDLLSLRRISHYLTQLASIIDSMAHILNHVRKGCDPAVFYTQIRPWFRGQGSRPWIFEGSPGLAQPRELSGPSAGQSSIIHVLDIFLGIDRYSHSHVSGGGDSSSTTTPHSEPPFLERMQSYMPRHHRAFLNHLKASPRPLRDIIILAAATEESGPEEQEGQREIRDALRDAYNASVGAVKRFRDTHIRIATLYIVSQARRDHMSPSSKLGHDHHHQPGEGERGTGGTDLVPFLKGVRDRTAAAIL